MFDLSVIIPVYNVENFIRKTLHSLSIQSNKNFEIIVINDGSTDNTKIVVERVAVELDLKHFSLINIENGGVSNARNVGIGFARGEFLYFLDGDDYVSDDFIDIIFKNIEANPNVSIIAWKYDLVDLQGNILQKYSDIYIPKDYFGGKTKLEIIENYVDGEFRIWTCSAIYNRVFLIKNNIQFTVGCINGEDQEFILKALFCSDNNHFIDEVLSFYLIREGSITNSYNIRKFDAITAIERVMVFIQNNSSDLNSESLLNKMESKLVVDHYFYNYRMNLLAYKRINNVSIYKSNEYLVKEIRNFYPELESRVKNAFKNSINNRHDLKKWMYFISPKMYVIYLKLRKFI